MSTAIDFSPLYRSMIGIDHMADLVETALRSEGDFTYPPYDIEKTSEDAYRITLAVAGFAPDELQVVAQPNLLVVSGRKAHREEGRAFLHRGLAGRDFERHFELADFVVVKSAAHEHGVLAIDLAREVPEPLKPRQVQITLGAPADKVERLSGQAGRRAA